MLNYLIFKIMFSSTFRIFPLNLEFCQGITLAKLPKRFHSFPKIWKGFCDEHLQYLVRNHPNIPTDLWGFLAYCWIQRSEAEIGNKSLITVIWILWVNIDWLVYSFVYICCVLLGRDNMMFQSCYKIKESVLGSKEARYSYGQKLLKYKIRNYQQSVTIFNNTTLH